MPDFTPEQTEEEDSPCSEPCDPDFDCPNCQAYWQRMADEGLWDAKRHRWTEAGWRNIILRA